MPNPVELVLIGAGQRGRRAYASYALAHPEQARFVAVAEPDAQRRRRFAAEHDIAPERCYASWEELLNEGQMAAGALITTQDQMHVAPAVAAMQQGYDVLLEKPMAETRQGCVDLVQTAEETGKLLQICHVLRYAPFFQTLHRVLEEGRLGEIITVEHRENVAYWHMAHSYVRGNWRNQEASTPMILAKCCHDLDILCWNMGEQARRLSSVGSLLHFRSDGLDAPTAGLRGEQIPKRCTDGCPIEPQCAFSAIGIYLEQRPFHHLAARYAGSQAVDHLKRDGFPYTAVSADTSVEGLRRALETGPYGRCVYRCDNNVVDHQMVSMEFASGASVVLVMHGHSHLGGRTMRYDGTRATLRGTFSNVKKEITIHNHASGAVESVPIEEVGGNGSGHGGGDWRLMQDFVRAVQGQAEPLTDARTSLESHLLGFAAEEARLSHTVVELDAYR